MKNVPLKSKSISAIDSLFQEPIETLCSYTAVDFAEQSAAAILPDKLRTLYLDQCKIYREINNEIAQDYLLYLTALVLIYRKCERAEKIIKQFICTPDSHAPQLRIKNPVWLKCVKMHEAIKRMGLLQSIKEKSSNIKRDTDYVKMLSIWRKRSRSHVVISKELEETFHFNRKENPEEYERLRKKFLRFRQKHQENLFKDLPWPSDDFYFFIDILKWCFIEITPGIYVLKNVGDSDVMVKTFLLKAFNVADQISQRRSRKALVNKIFAEYERLCKNKQHISNNNNAETKKLEPKIKKLETRLIRYNDSRVLGKTIASYSKDERQRLHIELRSAIIGSKNQAVGMGWTANGFTNLPIEISPLGKFIQTRRHLTGNGFKCIPAGSRLNSIQFELYIPQSDGSSDSSPGSDDKVLRSLKMISKPVKILDFFHSRKGRFMFFDIPATLMNFSKLMKLANSFPANTPFTITFEGNLKKTVFLKPYENIYPPQVSVATKAIDSGNNDNRKQKPKLSGRQKLDFLLIPVYAPEKLEKLMDEYNFSKDEYYSWLDMLYKKADIIFEDPPEAKGSEDRHISEP